MTQEITAVIKVDPGKDEAVVALLNEVTRILDWANQRTIATVEDVKIATNDLSLIAKLKKAVFEKRKEYLEPLKTYEKTINDAFKLLSEPLQMADRITRDKVLAYNAEQERIRQEQEEINRLRIEAAQKEMELTGELSESVDLVEVVPEAPKRIQAGTGTLGMRDNWHYEIVDFALLPDDYKLADTAMLNSIAKKYHDQKQVPGVRFYNEPIIAVNAK